MKDQLINEDFHTADGVYGSMHARLQDGECRWSCWAASFGVKAWADGKFPLKPKHEPKPDAEQILADTKARLVARVLAALAVT